MTISGPDDQVQFQKVIDKKQKQDRAFIEKKQHPVSGSVQSVLGMNKGEIWVSNDGSFVRLNYRAQNGDIYGITLPKI